VELGKVGVEAGEYEEAEEEEGEEVEGDGDGGQEGASWSSHLAGWWVERGVLVEV
jgi:hypothetical protein